MRSLSKSFLSKSSRIAAIAALAAAAVALTACSSGAPSVDETSAVEPVHVKFALPVSSPDAGGFVTYYMPDWNGFFEAEGLDVEFIPNDGGTAALRQVATGNADFSVNNPQALINAVGEGLGVVGVATIIPRQIYNFYVPKGSGIKTVEDLKGLNIGISSPTSGVYPFAQAGLAEAGLDFEDDVTLVTTGSGGPQLQALQNGSVDALATWDTQVATFANLGQELTALPAGEVADDPADILVTNTLFLKDNADVVTRFARAIMMSIAYSQDHVDEALGYYKDAFPQASDGTSDEDNLRVMNARLKTLKLADTQDGWGDIPLDGYQHLMDVSVEFGSISAEQNLSRVFDTSLLPDIQDFDLENLEP